MSVWVGKENSCIEDMQTYNVEKSIDNILPFIPLKETFFKKSGNVKKETSIMFPGYIFIETSMNAYDFLDYTKRLLRIYRNFITVLRYGDSDEMTVRWEERLALMKLMNHEWCVETSCGFKENNTVKITSGPLVGCEGQIKKIDRHKMKALVEVEMFDRKSLFELGLQVLTL